MAPIASLVVRISAQISELQKSFADSTKAVEGFKTSFDKQAASIQGAIDGISKTFEQFGSVVGTIGVAAVGVGAGLGAIKAGFEGVSAVVTGAVGALSDAVNHTAELGDSLFALSQKTGVSVESLSAFKFVAAQTNTSLDSISGAVFKLEANLGKGAKSTVDALGGIGLSLKDLQAQDPADAFGQIISKLGEIPNASERAAAGVAIFGKSFKDIAQLTQEDLPGLIGQAKELGLVMSTETAVAADRFGDAMGALRGVFEGIQLQIGAKLLPAIVAITETFGGIFIDGIKSATKATSGMGEVFDTVVVQIGQAIGRAIEVLAKMTDAVALWVSETSKRVAEQARTFLDLAPTFITVGKAFDLAFNGGIHLKAFDELAGTLEKLKAPLESVASGVQKAGDKIREISQGIATSAAAAGQNFGATYTRIQGEISAAADKMRASLKSVGDGGVEGASKASDAFKSFAKQLTDLTSQIDRAQKNGTPISELVRLFGDEAAKATPRAKAWGIAVKDSVTEVSRAFNAAQFEKAFDKIRLPDLTQDIKVQSTAFGDMWIAGIKARFVELPKTFQSLNDGLVKFGADLAKKQFDKLADTLHEDTPRVVSELTNPFRDAFAKLGEDLPKIILSAVQGGGSVFAAAAVGAATIFATSFRSQFNDALQAVSGDFSKLSAKNKALGFAATGLESFTSGFALGQGLGKGKGALAGAAAGAAIGANPALSGSTLGASIAIGAGVGALAGFFGGRSAEKKAKEQLEQNKVALAQQYGGLAKLNDLASKLGVNIQKAFDAKKPQQFQAVVDKLNAAIELQQKRTEGIATALDGVNQRSAAFAGRFGTQLTDLKKLMDDNNLLSSTIRLSAPGGRVTEKNGAPFFETGILSGEDTSKLKELDAEWENLAKRAAAVRAEAQPQFERIGLFVRDTFAAIIKETGDAIGAITQLAPSFDLLKKGINDFGLTSTAVIDSLIGTFDAVNNEAFKPFFENIQASGQLLKGLFDAQALSPDTFQAVAADIGQSIQEIVNRGGDMAKTLALSAPQLQTLWEAQQRYGAVTDQTTQSILDQAEAQGVVGAQFRDVNEKILDVLLAIADTFGAKIPDGIRATQAAAESAGKGITDSFGGAFKDVASGARSAAGAVSREFAGIRAPEIKIPVSYDFDASTDPRVRFIRDPNSIEIPALANGGIVRRPTLALVGEAGPEAVVPLNGSMFAPQNAPRQAAGDVFLDKDLVGKYVLKAIAEEAYNQGWAPR